MSFAFVSEGILPDTSLSLKSVAHLKNKKIHKIYMYRAGKIANTRRDPTAGSQSGKNIVR
jgi:hypothetical protein